MKNVNSNLNGRIFLFLVLATVLAIELTPLESLPNPSLEYLTFNGAYPWAVLFMCIVFLIAKRHENPISETSFSFVACGIVIVIFALFLPAIAPEFIVFRLLLAGVGLAFISFGRAAIIPSILLCIYGFGISFPKLVDSYAGEVTARYTAWIAYQIGHIFLPISASDSSIFILASTGERVVLLINAACSGAASMSVFLVIFMLMSLDMPLPRGKWVLMLIFGIMGTVAQNIIRIVVLLFTGYYFGPAALKDGESIAGYIIFPLWYMMFAFVYMKYLKKHGFSHKK